MKRMTRILAITVIVAVIAVGFVGCDPEVKTEYVNVYHGAIYAFDKVIAIEGYENMNQNHFNIAVERLQDAISDIESNIPSGATGTMIKQDDFKIEIISGSAPAVKVGNMLRFGIGFLTNTNNDIIESIVFASIAQVKSNDGVFLASAFSAPQREALSRQYWA